MRTLVIIATVILACAWGVCRAAENTVLRLGFETPRTDSQFLAAAKFAELVRERTGGAVNVKLYPDSVLGSGSAMLAAVRSGDLDMYLGGSGYFANFAQRLNLVDIPFLFRDYSHVDAVLTGPVGDAMLGELEAFDLKGLAFFENGFRCLSNNIRPVRSAGDASGLKIRTLDNPMHLETWRRLGAVVMPMPLSNLYVALESRTVDGQEHPLGVVFSARLYEVQRYISMTNHVYSPLILAMNEQRHARFPEAVRAALRQSAREAADFQKQYNRDNLAKQLRRMANAGCEIIPPGEIDIRSFVDILGSVTREMYLSDYGGPLGQAWLDAIDAESDDGR